MISGHLVAYADSKDGYLVAGGCTLAMELNGQHVKRAPDTALRPIDETRCSCSSERFSRDFFQGIPLLRALVLFQDLSPSVGQTVCLRCHSPSS